MNLNIEKSYEKHTVEFGTKSINVLVSFNHRKNLKISVHPDLSVTVDAPIGKSLEDILARVKKRAPWIMKQKRYYDRFQPLQPERQFVAGESHMYLGKQYRLRLLKNNRHSVKLKGGYFIVNVNNPKSKDEVKSLLTQWYKKHADVLFTNHLYSLHEGFALKGLPMPQMRIREMNSRWGSCSKQGTITLNLHLIKAPLKCIDYVIMHELCHLLEHNHTDKFIKLLKRNIPDWEKRKTQLEKVVII